MSDKAPHDGPILEHEPIPAPMEPNPPAREPGTRPLWIAFAVLLVLAAIGGYLLWSDGQARGSQVAALQGRLQEADTRLSTVESAPPPPPPVNIAPLQQAVTGLDGRLNALANKPPPQATLDKAGRQQIASLSGRIDSISARQDQLGTTEQSDVAKLKDQIAALTDKVAALSAQVDAKVMALSTQVDSRVTALSSQVDASTKASSAVTALSAREARTAQLQSAAAALAAGRPVGNIPDAPPPLARFATEAPPTEGSLRLSFDQAAQAARDAGQPTPDSMAFLQRMWQHAQSSVTVKAGNTLVVGNDLSGTLGHARQLLDAGDLAGAVAALDGLSGPAAQAIAPWRNQAQSLLDARAALILAAQH